MVDLGATCELAPEPAEESLVAAESAGLRFSADCQPGIRRIGARGAFAYERDDGSPISDEQVELIEALKIPPAWTRVWICADRNGHLQATGYDARGRKQYRYHAKWRLVRDSVKYDRLVEFGEALPEIRQRVDEDLRRPAVDQRRVVGLVVSLMDRTLARVGNLEYERSNDTFGLTTLKNEHAEVTGARIRLRFRGKAGKEFELRLNDPRLARALRRARDLPGEELFQYVDATGEQRIVGSADVNDYLRDAGGAATTSKDFRTWAGSFTAARALLKAGQLGRPPLDAHVSAAIREAAEVLGNTPAVCRRSYVHPGLIELYRSGRFVEEWERARRAEASRRDSAARRWLSQDERVFLGLLRRMQSRDAGG